MTFPFPPPPVPDPPLPMPGPCASPTNASTIQAPVLNADGTFTVPLTQCCGGMPGDVCDCASFASTLAVAFSRPIGWRAA